RGVLQQIILWHVQLIGVHPDELPAEFIAHRGKIFLGNEHVSATDITFVFGPEGMATTVAPGRRTPDARRPANPRKVESGRTTYCTGKRSGPNEAASFTGIVSRYSSKGEPSNHGIRELR